MKYLFNRVSVFLAIIVIVAALSFSEYRSNQSTKERRSKLSEVCYENDVYAVMPISRQTWISHFIQRFLSNDYVSFKSVDAVAIILEGDDWPCNGIPEVAQAAIEMWNISEIRFPDLLPEQEILAELRSRYPSVSLIGPDDKPIL